MKSPRSTAAAVVALALTLGACGQGEAGPDPAEPSATAPSSDTPPTASRQLDDGSPDLSPPELVPEAEKGETGARNVLLSFARAIELEEFDQAYAMLGQADRQAMTRAEFAALFDGFSEITVAVPTGTMEGAAGSIYYEVPTTITGSDGGKLSGTIVLRRVNDVPGASAEQLRWHLDRFEVAPA